MRRGAKDTRVGSLRAIERAVLALAAVAVLAPVAVGTSSYVSERESRHRVNRLLGDERLAGDVREVDMMHDALRADVYQALYVSAPGDQRLAVTRARDHQRRLLDALAAAGDRAATADPAIRDAVAAASRDMKAYAEEATTIVDLAAAGRGDAMAHLPALDDQFERLERMLATLIADADARGAAAGRAAVGAADGAQGRTVAVTLLVLASLAALTLGALRRMRLGFAEKAEADEEMARLGELAEGERRRQQFGNDLHEALEMADAEDDALEVVRRAIGFVAPQHKAELLLADSSQSHLVPVVVHPDHDGPGCPVASPWQCVAVRRGRAQVFEDPHALNACPKLREHAAPAPAVCVPVTFMGKPLGVLHAVTVDASHGASAAARLGTIAAQAGTRIGTLRAFARTELQAATDGLTGMLNRRSLEERLGDLVRRGEPFALAMADLDHFKLLNDAHGHEAGDRALRLFANVVREVLRADDVVGRYGGEEFVIALPGQSMATAQAALDRIRARLEDLATGAETPRFTASFGLADSTDGRTIDDVLRVADDRLRAAKLLGRDRVVAEDAPVS